MPLSRRTETSLPARLPLPGGCGSRMTLQKNLFAGRSGENCLCVAARFSPACPVCGGLGEELTFLHASHSLRELGILILNTEMAKDSCCNKAVILRYCSPLGGAGVGICGLLTTREPVGELIFPS